MNIKKRGKIFSVILAILIIISSTSVPTFASGAGKSQTLGTSAGSKGSAITPRSLTAEQYLQSKADEVTFDTIKNSNTDANNVTANLKKPSSYSSDYGAKITMTSSDTLVVKDDGTVIRPAYGCSDANITLTITAEASIMFNPSTYPGTKTPGVTTIDITVPALTQAEQDAAEAAAKRIVDYALDAIEITELKYSDKSVINSDRIMFDLQLVDPRDYFDPTVVPKETVDYVSNGYWTSSNIDVISINYMRGNVFRPDIGEDDEIATLTLTATKGSYSDTKTFVVTVKALTIEELNSEKAYIQKIADSLDFDVIKGSNTGDANSVTENMVPAYRGIVKDDGTIEWGRSNRGDNGVGITWEYGSGISAGAVTRPASGNLTTHATATISSINYKKYVDSHSQYVGNVTKEIDLVILGKNVPGTLSEIKIDNTSIGTLALSGNEFNYETTVPAGKANINISATGAGASISINGATAVTGIATANIPLSVGLNTIVITSSGGGANPTLTYTLKITRPNAVAVSVTTRIESNDMTIQPKGSVSVDNSTYDLTNYGFTSNPSYPTAMHALIATLENMGLDSTDPSVLKQSGGWLSSICGVGDNGEGYWMFAISGVPATTALGEYALNPDDDILFYLSADYTQEYIAKFDKDQASVQTGEKLALNLKGISLYDNTWSDSTALVDIAGAELLKSANNGVNADISTGIKTNSNGVAEISFDSPGVYIISAVGTTTPVIRPYCKVTVTQGAPVVTDQDLAEEAKNALSLGNTANLTADITLPANGINSTNITWASSNPSVITSRGVVTRPVAGQPNGTAVLTATITKGSVTLTKTFNITVLAHLQTQPLTAQEMITESKSYYWALPNKQLTSLWDTAAVLGAWGNTGGFKLPDYSIKPQNTQPTDYAGQILSMIALGQDPYTDCEINLPVTLAKMQDASGKFSTQPNQQIWATIALTKAGATFDRAGAVNAIIQMQSSNGAVEGSDITGMALIALSANRDIAGTDAAITKAVNYLKSAQVTSDDLAGGWSDNSNTTATVITGLTAAGQNVTTWTHSPVKALEKFRNTDGGFKYRLGDANSNLSATNQTVIALGDIVRGNSFWISMTSITPQPEPNVVDKTLLKKRIDYAEALNSKDYTSATYQDMSTKLTEAKSVYENTSATQVQVDTALDNLNATINNLKDAKPANSHLIDVSIVVTGIDNNSTILSTELEISKGSSAFEALQKALKAESITMKYSGSGSSVYVKSIDGLAEKTAGANSGWMYSINGAVFTESCGSYKLKNNDDIHFFFTTDYTTESNFSSGGGATVNQQADQSSPIGSGVGASGNNYLGNSVLTNPTSSLDKLKKSSEQITASYKKATELSDWEITGLIISGEKLSESRLKALTQQVKTSSDKSQNATDKARIALALQLSGQDIKNVGGTNLLKTIYSDKDMGKQGLNGYVFSLMVMTNDAKDIPKDATMTIGKVSGQILSFQNADGGFPLAKGGDSNLDITAMTIISLAPYKNNEKVKTSINKAVAYLASKQSTDGSFAYGGIKSSETLSQIIIALTSAGINPDDARFVKNSKTLMDTLYSYRLADGKFRHVKDGSGDAMATEQALIAMQSYIRYFEGKSPVYRSKIVIATNVPPAA